MGILAGVFGWGARMGVSAGDLGWGPWLGFLAGELGWGSQLRVSAGDYATESALRRNSRATFFATFFFWLKEISSLSFLKISLSNFFFSKIVILNLQLMSSSFNLVSAIANASAESSGFGGLLSSK